MNNTSSPTVIIAVPGGQETQELSLELAKAAFARGEIEPTRWAWCRTNQNWKPISELPEFQFEPNPVPVAQPAPVARVTPVAAAVPVVQARPIVQTVQRVKSGKELVVKEEPSFSFFKFFVMALGLAVVGVVGANYVLVSQPLSSNLLKTNFATTPVYAHLGAFFQPDTVIIHLRPSSNVNSKNLANFLTNLAQSTPTQPINQQPFSTVGLTSAWTSQFLMAGADWKTLGGMANATDDQQKDFILTHIRYPNGQPLVNPSHNVDPDSQAVTDRRNTGWENLSSTLVAE